jgi:hypothetical protein
VGNDIFENTSTKSHGSLHHHNISDHNSSSACDVSTEEFVTDAAQQQKSQGELKGHTQIPVIGTQPKTNAYDDVFPEEVFDTSKPSDSTSNESQEATSQESRTRFRWSQNLGASKKGQA